MPVTYQKKKGVGNDPGYCRNWGYLAAFLKVLATSRTITEFLWEALQWFLKTECVYSPSPNPSILVHNLCLWKTSMLHSRRRQHSFPVVLLCDLNPQLYKSGKHGQFILNASSVLASPGHWLKIILNHAESFTVALWCGLSFREGWPDPFTLFPYNNADWTPTGL